MNVTRFDDAVKYTPAKHSNTCHSMWLQHKSIGCDAPFWVGCSYYLPGATADKSSSPLDRIYLLLEGELTIDIGEETVKLHTMDSIHIGPGEVREVRNERNEVATMLVVMPYPPK